jgi:hypothetical protein
MRCGKVSIDVRELLRLNPGIHPKTAAPLIRAILAVTHGKILMDDIMGGGGCSPSIAVEYVFRESQLIADFLFPEHFAEQRDRQARSEQREAEWRARQRERADPAIAPHRRLRTRPLPL